MAKSIEPYEGEFTVTLDGWERRQIAMWAEDALKRAWGDLAGVFEILGKDFPKAEAERQIEWCIDLLRKLVPDEPAPEWRRIASEVSQEST